VKKGRNKENDHLPQINLALLWLSGKMRELVKDFDEKRKSW